MKRILATLLALVLLLSLCSFAAAEDKVVLKVYRSVPQIYEGWEYGDDPVSSWIEDLAGVDIQYSYATTSDHQELYTMMVSGDIDNYDIIITNGTYIPRLVDEEFVVPLNDIADEYGYQEFYDLLPNGMMGAHGIDGKLYYYAKTYGDDTLLATVPAGLKAPENFTINYPCVVERLGVEEGTVHTLDDVAKVCAIAKENGVDYPLFLSCTGIADPLHGLSWSQTMNTSMGGPGFVYPQADGTVTFNYKAEEYKAGLKWLNEMYRLGYVKADNFTFTASINDETVKQIALQNNVAFIVGHSWTLEQHIADYIPVYRAWKVLPLGEGVQPEDVRAMCWNGSQIGSADMWITAASENKLAALKWITTYMRPDVQIACLYGFEGEGKHFTVDYSQDPNGIMVKNPDMLADQANMTGAEFQKKWGYFNNEISDYRGRYGQVAWDRPTLVDENGKHTLLGDYDCTLGAIYAHPFKTGNLTLNLTDSDQAALLATLKSVWANALPDIVLAADDAAFEAAYQALLDKMEQAGMGEMETILTERYWKYADQLHEVFNAKWEAAVAR